MTVLTKKPSEFSAATVAALQDVLDSVPYTGATKDVDLGDNNLGTKEIKTNNAAPADLLVTTGANKTLVLSEPVYRDEYPNELVPAAAQGEPEAITVTIGGVPRRLRSYDGNNTQELLSGSFEIPHDYMLGEPIEVHVHWRPATTGTGAVKWFFDYEYSPPNSAPIPQDTLTAIDTLSENKQYWHLLKSFGNMPDPSTPFAIGGKIGFNIRRTPTDDEDTYAGDALLEQIALHVPTDTQGSRQIYIK